MKFKLLPLVLIFCFLISACGQSNQDLNVAVAVALTQTAAAVPAPTAVPTAVPAASTTGIISGRVHLASPPTPPMMVYAQDMTTWEWASVKTEAADGEASYTLTVKPGSYVIFAFADDGSGSYAGYPTVDGLMLGTVTVAAGQTVTDVNLIPPSQSECGSLWGAPPSPDGRFASVSPSGACLAEKAASGAYQPVSAEVCQIIKESADQALSVSFYMIPNDTFTDPVTGETGLGCTLKAAGTVSMFGNPNQVVTKLKNAFGGWEEKTSYQASGPTGEATAMTRDMGLMLINAGWEPAPEIQCPADQPITACNLEDDMKLYTILIQVAQK